MIARESNFYAPLQGRNICPFSQLITRLIHCLVFLTWKGLADSKLLEKGVRSSEPSKLLHSTGALSTWLGMQPPHFGPNPPNKSSLLSL